MEGRACQALPVVYKGFVQPAEHWQQYREALPASYLLGSELDFSSCSSKPVGGETEHLKWAASPLP